MSTAPSDLSTPRTKAGAGATADAQAAVPDEGRPRRMAPALFWAMLIVIAVLAAVAVIAMLGWDRAIHRADEQTTRAAALQAAARETASLRQTFTSLQPDLTDARGHEQALQAQLRETKAALTQAQGNAAETAAAEERAAAAEKVASTAERMRAELQEQLNAALAATARVAERSPPQPANTMSAATARSGIAPELPLPELSYDATPRDYLVAAQQAVRNGMTSRAQAALERAETRMLNQASLTRDLARLASHPGITQIERALDQLGNGDTEGVLGTIERLLMQH